MQWWCQVSCAFLAKIGPLCTVSGFVPCTYALDGANGGFTELTGQCLVAAIICMSDYLGHVIIVCAAAAEASPYGNLQNFYKNFLACTYEHTLANLLYMQIPVLVVYNRGAIEPHVILERRCIFRHSAWFCMQCSRSIPWCSIWMGRHIGHGTSYTSKPCMLTLHIPIHLLSPLHEVLFSC